MKRGFLLLGLCTIGFLARMQAAPVTISITDSTFSSGFTGWTCPNGTTCGSTIDTDPYWEYVGSTWTGGPANALHIGAYSSANMGFVFQTDTGYHSTSTNYLLSISYGQWNPYNTYTSPDFSEADGVFAYIGSSTSHLTAVGSWTNVWSTASTYVTNSFGKQFGGFTANATACFTIPSGLPGATGAGDNRNDGVKIAAYDTLEDVIVTSVSIVSSNCSGGVTTNLLTQLYMDGAWVDVSNTDPLSSAPEPKTLGIMALACAAIVATYLKFRPAQR